MNDEELRQLFDTVRQENAAAHEETRRLIREESAAAHGETRRILREEITHGDAETRTVLREENAAAHEETRRILREEITQGDAETRRYTKTLFDATQHDIQLVAEAVAILDEKLDRTATAIRSEMRTGFDETHAMITGLDRRLTAVERAVNN